MIVSAPRKSKGDWARFRAVAVAECVVPPEDVRRLAESGRADEALALESRRAAAAARVLGLPTRRSDFYGSSQDFDEWLREERPGLVVPEGAIVPRTGTLGWSPRNEVAPEATCPDCAGVLRETPRVGPHASAPVAIGAAPHRPPCPQCGGPADPGSLLYCPLCTASGYERQLRRQREIAGLPPAEPPRKAIALPGPQRSAPTDSPERPETRRERRARQFARAAS